MYSVITNMFVDESNSLGVVLCQLIELKLPTFNVDIDCKYWNWSEIATPPPPPTGWWINRSFIEYRWVRIRANDSLLLSASKNLSRGREMITVTLDKCPASSDLKCRRYFRTLHPPPHLTPGTEILAHL